MTDRPAEETRIHTRLLRFTLAVEDCRAYWEHVDPAAPVAPSTQAFEEHWFGAKSQARVKITLANLHARFDAFPSALAALCLWRPSSPDTRRAICHWHTQLADPLYRAFTGEFLVQRRDGPRAEIDRDRVAYWVDEQQPGRWASATLQGGWASKLLTTAHDAGLVGATADPRPLTYPKVPDDALAYQLHLLREVEFEGTLTDNPYLASVGLTGGFLEDRLRGLDGVDFRRMGDLTDFNFHAPDLRTWAEGIR